MKKIFLTISILFSMFYSFTQTISSKSCGKCLKAVSNNSKIGDYCPHCGVRWGYENSSTSTINSSRINQQINLKEKKQILSTSKNKNKSNNTDNQTNNPFSHYFDGFTKLELQNWLEEKLTKYSKENIYCSENSLISPINKCWSNKEFEFKFQDEYFIVKYNYNDEYYKIDYLPMFYLNIVSAEVNGNDFYFSSSQNTKTDFVERDTKKNLVSGIIIGFKTHSEENIIEKIKTAFFKLKKISMKTDLTILPNVLFPSDLNKPSISDTKEWILNKLNKYTENQIFQNINGSYSGMRNPVFSFSAMNLIIEYYNAYNDLIQVIIPVCECNMSNKIYNDYFNSTTYENYSFFSKEELITIRGNQTKKFYIKLNFDKEDNLYSRLQKAFNSLKEDCPKKIKEKEAF